MIGQALGEARVDGARGGEVAGFLVAATEKVERSSRRSMSGVTAEVIANQVSRIAPVMEVCLEDDSPMADAGVLIVREVFIEGLVERHVIVGTIGDEKAIGDGQDRLEAPLRFRILPA